MPANLSEGVFQQRCSDCGGVCCEDARRRGEGEGFSGYVVVVMLVFWRGAAFVVAEGAKARSSGRSDPHSATFTCSPK